MTLKAVVEKEEDVPENLRDEYVERDGRFYLDLDDSLRAHTGVTPLANALTAVRKERDGLKTRLAESASKLEGLPETFDPAEYASSMAELERLKSDPEKKPDVEAMQNLRQQLDERNRNNEERYRGQLKDLQDRLDREVGERDAELNEILAGDGLRKALVEAGVDKRFLNGACALLRGSVRVIVDEDTGKRRPVVETDLGEQDLKSFAETWAKSDEGKFYVAAPTGGGAEGSSRRPLGENPFSSEHWDVTKQGRLVVEKGEPAARRMAEAAGTTLGGPRPSPRVAAPAR